MLVVSLLLFLFLKCLLVVLAKLLLMGCWGAVSSLVLPIAAEIYLALETFLVCIDCLEECLFRGFGLLAWGLVLGVSCCDIGFCLYSIKAGEEDCGVSPLLRQG